MNSPDHQKFLIYGETGESYWIHFQINKTQSNRLMSLDMHYWIRKHMAEFFSATLRNRNLLVNDDLPIRPIIDVSLPQPYHDNCEVTKILSGFGWTINTISICMHKTCNFYACNLLVRRSHHNS